MNERERPTLQVISGGKGKEISQKESYKEIIFKDAVINSEQIFSKDEIANLIYKIAEKEGYKKDQLEEIGESYDTKGNLLVMVFRVARSRVKSDGWGDIQYQYSIAFHSSTGHWGNSEGVPFICRVNAPISDPQNFVAGDIVAEYLPEQRYRRSGILHIRGAGWEIHTGNYAPSVDYNELIRLADERTEKDSLTPKP